MHLLNKLVQIFLMMKKLIILTLVFFAPFLTFAQTWVRTVTIYDANEVPREIKREVVTNVVFKKYDPSGQCHFQFTKNGEVTHTPLVPYASKEEIGQNTTRYHYNGKEISSVLLLIRGSNGINRISYTEQNTVDQKLKLNVTFEKNHDGAK
jgi:hypothetical protein